MHVSEKISKIHTLYFMLLTKPRAENINRIFAILEPNIFPTDKSANCSIPSIETKSSGIMSKSYYYSPTKKSETLSFRPKPTEEDEIRISAPLMARNRLILV